MGWKMEDEEYVWTSQCKKNSRGVKITIVNHTEDRFGLISAINHSGTQSHAGIATEYLSVCIRRLGVSLSIGVGGRSGETNQIRLFGECVVRRAMQQRLGKL